jgi:putative peptidoglycan lipid II flippase
MRRIAESLPRLARHAAALLITGESGVGKEHVAQLFHRHAAGSENKFIAVNCASIPEPLMEAELFGYERGAFTPADTRATALVLAIYGLGLPAFVLHKVLLPLFYAREDTSRPFRYAVVSMVLNALIAVGLMPWLGFAAAAWATTLAGWVMVWQLWSGSRRMGPEATMDDRFRTRLPRIIAAALIMGAALYAAAWALAPWLDARHWRFAALGVLVTLGIVTYFGAGALIGAFRLSEFRALRRKS